MMPPKLLNFFSDSSSHRGHTYVVVGGLAITPERTVEVEQKIQELKDKCGIKSELKWSKYKAGGKRAAYEGTIDLFFELLENDQAHFHSIICDFKAFDHKLGGLGNPEKSVNKLYYQLMLHSVCRQYGPSCRVIMFPDHGNDSAEIVKFRGAICAGAFKAYKAIPNCLRDINPVPSSRYNVMQMVDLVLGGMAASREGRVLGTNKSNLRDYIHTASGIHDFSKDRRNGHNFKIWNFKKK